MLNLKLLDDPKKNKREKWSCHSNSIRFKVNFILHDEDNVELRLWSESECGVFSTLVLWLDGRGLLANDIRLAGGSPSGVDIKFNPGGRGGGEGLTK
jgi:hypothetical protein